MFTLNQKYEVDRKTLLCVSIRYSPSEKSTKTANSQTYFNIPRKDSVICLLNSYLDLNFDVLLAASNNTYGHNNDVRLVYLGPTSLFSNYKLTKNSGKHLEDICHGHLVSLMHKIITSTRGSDVLSIGFDRDRWRRQQKLTKNKNQKGKYHIRVYLKDFFGFAEHQKKAIFGLGYKLTLTRTSDNPNLNKDKAINIGKTKTDSIECSIPHHTPSINKQAKLSKQILNKVPTEVQFAGRSVSMKEVNTQTFGPLN